MVDNPNETPSEPASSETVSTPVPTAASEGIKGVEGVKEPEKVEESQNDTAPQQDATSEDEEEGKGAYRPGGFHPVYIGDIFNDRYKVLNKIGYGLYSTVWLVKDLQATVNGDVSNVYRALKVLRADCYGHGTGTFEREILRCLRDGSREHPGYPYVCHLIDDFEHQGPNGTHVCFIFELMGETLRSFGTWFPLDGKIPYEIMLRFAIQLVLALWYAHDHDVIHTDIKPNNIFVKFRDWSFIESGYLKEIPVPQQDREEAEYRPVPSQPLRWFYFDYNAKYSADFDVNLGDWGVSSWTTKHLTEVIQPVALRAPEVIIGAPWDASTDWWNFGAVLLEVFRCVRMFDGGVPPDGHYEPREHLIEIIDFCGPFPKKLLEKGNQDLVCDLFDDEGGIKDAEPLNRPGLMSEAITPGLSRILREYFVSFMNLLMKIDPEERPSALDLLKHPFMGAV
ncbi:kinase-like domain-containing protein [Trichoderma afarasin]